MAKPPQLVCAVSQGQLLKALHALARKGARLCATSIVCLGLLAVAACKNAVGHHRVAVIPRLSADAQWLSLHIGVTEEAERLHMEPFWHGPSGDQTVQEQIQLITDAVHSNAYGIIVRPGAFVAENRVLDEALAKNIPVVVLSEKVHLPFNSHLYYVLEDTHTTGRLVAERLRTTVGKGNIAILGLEPEVPGSIDRSDALEQWIHAITPDVHVMNKLMSAPSGSYLDQSLRQMIVEHPELRAIVALSAGEGLSAATAISAAGAKGRVKLIVCDQSIDLLLLLRSGMVDSIVVQQIRNMGAKAMEDIADDRAGRKPAKEISFSPTLVTAENVDTEEVQRMLLMHRSPPW